MAKNNKDKMTNNDMDSLAR